MDDTCENCEYGNADVHSKPCVDCDAGKGRPTNWKPKTDCQW
jgi:hypothetical protein